MNLFEKLLEIRKAMPYLKKENVNQGQGFNYVSSSQALKVFREKADALGVLIIPEVQDAKVGEKGKQVLTELDLLYTVVNVEDPKDLLEIHFYAQGLDIAEKGVGKALTYGEKYLILKLFNVPTDLDDPDAVIPTNDSTSDSLSFGETAADIFTPKVDEDTQRFKDAMTKIRDTFKKRDNHDNAVGMMIKVMGYASEDEIVEKDARTKLILTLLEEFGVKKVSDLDAA